MSTLEHTIYQIRRGWRTTGVFMFAGAFAAIFVGGSFVDAWADASSRFVLVALFAAWAAVFGIKAHRRFSNYKTTKQATKEREDLELGLLLVVATHGFVQVSGGLNSLLYPIVFVLIAFLVVYTAQWVGFSLVGVAIGIEFALVGLSPSATEFKQVLVHSIFIVFFALINLVFTRTEVARMRRLSAKAVKEVQAAMANDAKDFRLIAPSSGHTGTLTREEESSKMSRASMSQIRGSMFHHVELLKKTMKLNTCAVLWLDTAGKNLRVRECISDTEDVVTVPFDKSEGAMGAILKNNKPLRLNNLKPNYNGLSYYAEKGKVTNFAGVPIFEGNSMRGIICADRTDNKPFEEQDLEILGSSSESLLNIIANERVLNQLQKAKSEQSKLLLASDTLAKTLSEKDVITAALEAARLIVNYDIGVVALAKEKGRQVVAETAGENAESLNKMTITSGSSLVSMALKNRHYLPYRGNLDPKQQILFSQKSQKVFAKARSAMVLPIIAGENALGTLTLASFRPSVFDDETRTTLQVMINQLGTVFQNAKMYQKLKEMATTDGLTGLPNHRVFQEELDKKLASATRFRSELSVIFCDVDKFKNVNDTYGHPVGDQVLRGLGTILKDTVVRDTDIPARYGGEEFAIICEGTGTNGAFKLADRIRKSLEAQTFHTEQGDLRVTISMGVATYPLHAHKKEDLVERADAALYAAKEGGRNQVRTWEKNITP